MTRTLSERHPCTSSVENDQYNRFTSCVSRMECIDCLGNRLSGGKALLLALSRSLKVQFSGDDVGSAWHRMTVPFQLSLWRDGDFHYRERRLARLVRFVWLTIPRRTGAQKDPSLYWWMILPSSDRLNPDNRKCYKEECFHTPPYGHCYIHDEIR